MEGLSTILPSRAQEEDVAKTPSRWQVQCNDRGEGLKCKAVQTIVLRKTRKRLLSVAVSQPGGEDAASILVQLPHGLFLPAGLSYDIDGQHKTELPIQTCNRGGCYAGSALEAGHLQALKQGAKLMMRFQNLDKKAVAVPVSLKGFTAVFEKL